MNNRHVNRSRFFTAPEISFVGLLAWVVFSSLIAWQSNTVQARKARATEEMVAEKQDQRSVPPEGAPGSTNAVATLGTPNACTGFDFESGAQGFTVVPVTGAPLWHPDNALCRASLAGHSTPFTFYYGQDASCNYNTGAINASSLVSPPIGLGEIFPPFTLGFNYLLFVEGGGSFDTTFVDVSTDNGVTWTQVLSKASLINDNQWHNIAKDVTAAVGAATSVRVRFRFDSIDDIANNTTGWQLDDVLFCGQPYNFCVQDDNTKDYLKFNSVTGVYETKQCGVGLITQGVGVVTTNGNIITLQQSEPAKSTSAIVDTSALTGSASIKVVNGLSVVAYTINDSNITNNICVCDGGPPGPPCTVPCPNNVTTGTGPGSKSCGSNVSYPPPSAACGAATCTPPSGSFFFTGSTIVTCTAPGATNCKFKITVVDDSLPGITCPGSITIAPGPGQPSAVGNYAAATATDNCAGVKVHCSPPSGSRFPVGPTFVTCTAIDSSSNSTTCVFRVTVVDLEPPVISCPANLTAGTQPGQTSAVVTYLPPSVTDNVPGVSVVCAPASGSSFPLGVTTVTCTATDVAGNKASCSFTVGVGAAQVTVVIPGSKAAVEFGNLTAIPPARKPPKAKKNPCSSFTVQNIGFTPLMFALDSITRTGSDVGSGKIGDANDTKYFTLSLLASDGSTTPVEPGGVVTIQPGSAQSFCLRFSALIPALAGKTTAVAASDTLPDTLTSSLTFRLDAESSVTVPLLAHIATAVVLINGTNPRQPPTVRFTHSGNDLTVSYAVYDANLDVSHAKYEFLGSAGQVVGQAFEIDLAEQVRAAGLLRGQSFGVEQRFTSDTAHPEIAGVRVTVFDGETSTTESTTAASVTTTVRLLKRTGDENLFLPTIRLNATLP